MSEPRRSRWRRFWGWWTMEDLIETYDRLLKRMDALEQRTAAIEAALEPEKETPRRGSEWETLG